MSRRAVRIYEAKLGLLIQSSPRKGSTHLARSAGARRTMAVARGAMQQRLQQRLLALARALWTAVLLARSRRRPLRLGLPAAAEPPPPRAAEPPGDCSR